MRKKIYIFNIILALVLLVCLSSCKKGDKPNPDQNNDVKLETEYTVSFDTLGGSTVDDVKVEKGKTLDLANYSSSLDGYTFSGWATDVNFNNIVTSLEVNKNQTVYAVFDEKCIVLSFDTDGGSTVDSITQYRGTVIKEPVAPTKEGYVFSGWYKDAECTKKYDFISTFMPSTDFTLYAKWDEASTITIVSNIDYVTDDIVAKIGDEVKAPLMEKEGYEFDGFYTSDAYETKFYFNYAPKENTTVYAKWHKINDAVKLTYMVDGSVFKEITSIEGEEAIMNEVPSYPVEEDKEYFAFGDWYLNEELTSRFDGVTPSEDTVLYAKFVRDAKYSLISFEGTDISFYVKKGEPLSSDVFAKVEEKLVLENGTSLNGYLTSDGKGFQKDSLVAMDMVLVPNIYSDGLEFIKLYEKALDQYGFTVDVLAGYGVKGYTKDAKDIVIPSYYNDYKVIEIMEEAFKGNSTIETVTFPSYLKVIRKNAFENCTGLKVVDLPSSLLVIDDYAFAGDTNLETFNINSKLINVGFKILKDTLYVTNLAAQSTDFVSIGMDNEICYEYISENIKVKVTFAKTNFTLIAGGAFAEKSMLNITIPATVTTICNGAFKGSKCATFMFADESSLTRLYDEVFMDCVNMSKITLPNSLMQIGDSTFKNCTKITTVNLPDNLRTTGKYTFENCTALTGFTYTSKSILPTLAEGTFKGCSSLKEIMIPDCVMTVESKAFDNCENLERVFFGNSYATKINLIKENIISDCDKLFAVYIARKVDSNGVFITIEQNAFPHENAEGEKMKYHIYVPSGVVQVDGKSKTYTELYKEIIDKEISDYVEVFDTKYPTLTIFTTTYEVECDENFDLRALLLSGKIFTYEDDRTAKEDLVLRIEYVKYDSKEITPNEDGTYDFSQEGDYEVKFFMFDDFGNGAGTTLTLVAKKEA